MALIKIGVKAKTYRENRNFTGLILAEYTFVKVWDIYKIPAYIYFKVFGKPHRFWLNLFWRPWSRSPKIYHFFNAINRGNQSWVVTTEGILPWGAHKFGKFKSEEKYIKSGINRLIHPSCKKIIALSEYARQAQLENLRTFPKEQEIIRKKIVVWHPPQTILIDDLDKKTNTDQIKFLFVGADFFRKGGMEILIAFDQLLQESKKLSLTIVSSLNYGDYASATTEKDLQQAKKIISTHPQITHYHSLPNEKVITLFKESHIGLLPSYEETYGYTVLESQASGCPIITTNGVAFPEINNNDCGWIINLPLDQDQRTVPRTPEHRALVRKIIVENLLDIIRSIDNNRDIIKQKAANSLDRIKKFHPMQTACERLSNLYKEILNDKSDQ